MSGAATGGVAEHGAVDFVDNAVDSVSGTVTLKARFAKYQRAISMLKEAPKEKAPDALASMILRRTRRRRFQLRTRDLQNAHFPFPAEVVVPMLIAALAEMFMLLASP